jgi:hypothetical protein
MLIVAHRSKHLDAGASGSVATMMRARTALIIAGTALLASGLSACEKPNPGASVFSGTTSQWQQAVCWAHEGASNDITDCAQNAIAVARQDGGIPSITAIPGDVVGISVDPVVADTGWQVNLVTETGNDQVPATPFTGTYLRYVVPQNTQIPESGILLGVVAGSGSTPKGLWLFKIVPA